ncbi:Uu.00g044790.m01.CDS01 [Anthostomella pinea]|uniref:Uu.00g044790.m01.CDS01 n=1 Tax=Anthostomella pinea TaxID=933095 RepID=A0AAI8VC18_9PEZI|nr:Uu.00g044790.m01.CDS01 [Anthostomella pinea]
MALPSTTIIPFSALPSCAVNCGPLYDANGACVPPVATATDVASWDSCLCGYAKLQPFSSTSAGVCDTACTADAGGLASIQTWFTSFCGEKAAATATSSSATSSSTSSGSSAHNSQDGGGDWLSTHWKWVIMIVIVVVGIIGIWVGACIWRRQYLKRKDRLYELGKGLPSNVAVNTQGALVGPGARDSQLSGPGARDSQFSEPGMFMSGSGVASEKPKTGKSWKVNQRT